MRSNLPMLSSPKYRRWSSRLYFASDLSESSCLERKWSGPSNARSERTCWCFHRRTGEQENQYAVSRWFEFIWGKFKRQVWGTHPRTWWLEQRRDSVSRTWECPWKWSWEWWFQRPRKVIAQFRLYFLIEIQKREISSPCLHQTHSLGTV